MPFIGRQLSVKNGDCINCTELRTVQNCADCINSSISDGIFPDALKLADISPIFKKGNETDKVNYRPISLLPAISKVYEKIIYIQLEEFMHDKFNKLLCGFRKQHSTQHALLNLLQNWQTIIIIIINLFEFGEYTSVKKIVLHRE